MIAHMRLSIYYLRSNGVSLWNGSFNVIVAVCYGNIFNDITSVDYICKGGGDGGCGLRNDAGVLRNNAGALHNN